MKRRPKRPIRYKSRVHLYRALHEMTQKDLASKVGISRQTLNYIENYVQNPSLSLAYDMADVFDCSVEDLFPIKKEQHQDTKLINAISEKIK